MITSANNVDTFVQAKAVRFDKNILFITLSDGREVSLPIDQMGWLKWLVKATADQRAKWTIEPGGYAIYWEELDDGIELEHLLSTQALE